MHGTLSIYQGYLEGGKALTEPTPMLHERNLIVDGMKEHIVDLMTRVPAPSSVSADVAASYDVSNFTVQAMTVGPNRSAFDKKNGLAGLSGYVGLTESINQYRDLDPSDGTSYVYNEDIPNHQFSAMNTSGYPSPNGQLKNPAFSALDGRLVNGRFRDYSLDRSLSGVHMNEILGLYELNGWEVSSYLRDGIEAPEFDDATKLGSCSRHDFDQVSGIYSFLSGTDASSTFAEADDGVLFIRSFEDSTTTLPSSGLVTLRQNFSVRTPEILREASVDGTDNVLVEVTAQFSSLSGGANSRIHVNVRDATLGENYAFTGATRNSWGVAKPLVVNAVADASGTISHFINIPSSRVSNEFTVSFDFYCDDAEDVLKCYFWNANVNLLEGWCWGNIFSGQSMHRVWSNNYRDPALYISTSGSAEDVPWNLPLSSVTYLAQPFKLKPLKKYSTITAFSGTAAFTPSWDFIHTGVVKRFTSNIEQVAGYNHLTTSGSFPLCESRLPSNFAMSPNYPPTSPPSQRALQKADVRPSDLCLEVSGGSTVSGTFELSSPGILRGEILNSFGTGVSATDELKISMRTQALDADGNQRWFNFRTGVWDVYEDSLSGDLYFNSTSISGEGFVSFSARQLELNSLIGVVSANADNTYTFSLVLENGIDTTTPAFVKNLRVDSYPKSLSTDVQEVFRFSPSGAGFTPSSAWKVASNSGQYIFSGLDGNYLYPSHTNATTTTNTLGSLPIECMYLASGSVHSAESEYRFYLMQSTDTIGANQHAYKFNLVDVVDSALVPSTKAPQEDRLTSESYANTENFDFVNQPFIEYVDSNNVYSYFNYRHPGPAPQSPAAPAHAGLLTQTNQSLIIGSPDSPGGELFPNCRLSYVENLSSIKLPLDGESTQRSFSVEFNQLDANQSPVMQWRAGATTKDGDILWWNGTTWDEYETNDIPFNNFLTVPRRSGTEYVKTILSSKFDITNERFDETTKIKVSIVLYGWNVDDVVALLNWKFFTNTELPSMDMPEFPAPNDTTLQPPASPCAELGHFTNQIALSGALSGINLDRAMGNINWTPSAGLVVSGVPVNSYLNSYDVINSDGYVLFGYNGPITQTVGRNDYDYYVNGFNAVSSTSSMTYTVDVSSGAMNYFQIQGGIGCAGLHTFNIDETYRKLKDNGHSLDSVYDKGALSADTLYILTDVTRNPIFRLAAKKVFRLPLTYGAATNRFIRLSWEIRFI